MKYVQKNKKFSLITNLRRYIILTLTGFILFSIIACGDEALDTSKFASGQNNDFKLTLTISDDIVRTDDTIKLIALLERLVDKALITGSNPPTTMKMDAIGGALDFHSPGSTTSITVKLDDEVGSTFETLAFFDPKSGYSTGHVSASYDGINVSMSIDIVEPR
ncbi:MAG: hypothetical protein ACJZ1P_03695 [Candidatus Neomarinimicrobiota bacterium]